MTLGEKIKQMRVTLRYSQRELADILQISQTAISQYELGQKQPSLNVVKKFLKFAKENKLKLKLLDE